MVPPPVVQLTVICVALFAVAEGDVGFGGATKLWVVAVAVAPLDKSGVALAFAAQTLKLY